MKRAFVLTTLLAVAGAALAQTHVLAEAQLPDGATKMIVRDYLSPATVSYIATASQNFFAYADAGNLMYCMPLDSKYDVHDMKILNGNVYFCGQETLPSSPPSTRAFLGWFNVMDILNSVDGFHIYNNFVYTGATPVPPTTRIVEHFDQLEVYQKNDVLHIALVGETDAPLACFAEVVGSTTSATWSYTTACPTYSPYTETATNIVQNDTYFITGGTLFGNHEAVSMRFFKKDAMFTPTGSTGDIAYRYTDATGPTAIFYPRTKFAMAVIGEDHLATASFWSYPHATDPTLYNSGYDGLLVNVYKISATTAYISIPTTVHSVKSTYFQPITSSVIERMVYSPVHGSLYVLSQHLTPYGQQSLISEVNIPPSTTVPNTYLPDYDILDIDNTFATNRYVGIGVKKGVSDRMVYYSQRASDTPLCASTFSAPVSDADFDCKAEYWPLHPDTHSFSFVSIEIPTLFHIPITIDCQH